MKQTTVSGEILTTQIRLKTLGFDVSSGTLQRLANYASWRLEDYCLFVSKKYQSSAILTAYVTSKIGIFSAEKPISSHFYIIVTSSHF